MGVCYYLVSYYVVSATVYHEPVTSVPYVIYDLVKDYAAEVNEEMEGDIGILVHVAYADMDDY